MRHATAALTKNNNNLARFAVVAVGSAMLALAGCAADAAPEAADHEGQAMTSAEALAIGGGGVGAGFTCEGDVCTCSKSIEGDCDRMRKNCTGDLSGLDACLKGWLTTDCTCTYARTVVRSPIIVPRVGIAGTLAAP